MLSWSERSFQLWLSLELRLLFLVLCTGGAPSGSSGGLNGILGIGPIRVGSRSLRTFCGLPGPKPWHSREWCPNVVFPLCVSKHGFEPCHLLFRSSASVLLSRPCQTLRAMLVVCTRLPLRCVRLGSGFDCRLWSRVYCHAACGGHHASRGLSTLMVVPAFFSISFL